MNGEEDVQRLREKARKQREAEQNLRLALQQLLDSPAFERLSNIRLSNPPLYEQVASVILSLYKAGQLSGKLSEDALKKIVAKLVSQRKEPEIKFFRK